MLVESGANLTSSFCRVARSHARRGTELEPRLSLSVSPAQGQGPERTDVQLVCCATRTTLPPLRAGFLSLSLHTAVPPHVRTWEWVDGGGMRMSESRESRVLRVWCIAHLTPQPHQPFLSPKLWGFLAHSQAFLNPFVAGEGKSRRRSQRWRRAWGPGQ